MGVTRAELEKRARARWDEAVAVVGIAGADDAATQVGLPAVFVWTNLPGSKLFLLAVALRIRIMEARP